VEKSSVEGKVPSTCSGISFYASYNEDLTMNKGETQNGRDDLPGGEGSGAVTIVRPTRCAWYYARDKTLKLLAKDAGQTCMGSLSGI
jgi:hypothetical protein